MRSLTSVLFVMLAACSGSSAKPDAIVFVHDDAPVDVLPPPGPNQVTLLTFTSPSYIAYRDGKGPWLTPVTSANQEYVLNVTNDYEWLVVCAGSSSSDAEEGRATFADGAMQFVFCLPDSPSTTVQITGQMVQAGEVWMSDTATSETANWTFNLAVTPGTHDLIAVADNRMLIQRARTVTTAASIGSLDLDASGTVLTPVPLTINNLGTDTLHTYFELELANDAAELQGSSATLLTPPASLIVPADYQYINLSATSQTSDRTAFVRFTGTETTYTLMAELTGATLAPANGAETATWGTLPTYTSTQIYVYGETSTQHVTATQAWLDANNATTLAFDASAPGWNAAWAVDLTGSYFAELEVDATTGGIQYTTAIGDGGGSSVRKLPQQRARIARARAALR